MLVLTRNSALGKWRQKDQELKVILDYIATLISVCDLYSERREGEGKEERRKEGNPGEGRALNSQHGIFLPDPNLSLQPCDSLLPQPVSSQAGDKLLLSAGYHARLS